MIRLRQVKIKVLEDNYDNLILKITKLLKIKKSDIINFKILKQSIDARNKNDIYFVYEIDINLKNEDLVLRKNKNILKVEEDELRITKGKNKLNKKIIIVGSGPAGLFAGYLLAEYGYSPLIIERGKKVEDRIIDVENFWNNNILDFDSNVQFGEGGAGTFSDGKLNTLIKDKEHLKEKVLDIFIKNGAPPKIAYVSNPHIGTDILRNVIKNMRDNIIKMGGEICYKTKLTNIIVKNNELEAIEINHKDIIPCSNLILAIGHSARDTFLMLSKKLEIISKPFAVGLRVMHKRSMIDDNQYGKFKDILGPASYKLTYTTKDRRGVYSFCMCPGGYVVNASSEDKGLVINGMSNHLRDTETSNSAIVVTVTKDDFGSNILDGINYQRELEQKTYSLGKGKIPIQLLKDFKKNKTSTSIGNVKPIMKGDYILSNLRDIVPDYIASSIIEAFSDFDKKIKGFNNDDTILAAIETRTSSPIRIIRDDYFESNIKGVFPCGEGAGYAGGITSSAIDGLKVARELISRYEI